MRLRPDAWEEIALSDREEASASIGLIVALNDFCQGRSKSRKKPRTSSTMLSPAWLRTGRRLTV